MIKVGDKVIFHHWVKGVDLEGTVTHREKSEYSDRIIAQVKSGAVTYPIGIGQLKKVKTT